MGYKRAEWHSGLTYRQTCEMCKTVVEYNDHRLGFRPWYADGFVYCPTCKKPLRHNENYAIDRPEAPVVNVSPAAPVFTAAPAAPQAQAAPVFVEKPADSSIAFCTQCGKAFREGDKFCSGCGSKRA